MARRTAFDAQDGSAVTTATAAPAAASTARRPAPLALARADAARLVLWTIVALQAVWLGILMSRGWYYQDDLAFLAQAHHRSLGLGYLTDPVNDHLTPGLRLGFWLLEPLGASAYGATIALRLVLQAAATLLLDRLMVRLVGRTWLGLGVLAGYAFSPLLLGMLWLSCAVSVLPAQLLVLAGFLALIEYIRSGRLRLAVAAGLAFGAAATFLELSAINAVLTIPLALGFVYSGTARQRLAAMCRQWLGWLAAALPLAGFAVAYVTGGYGRSARGVHAGTLAHVAWTQWTRTVSPMALGGPWHWFAVGDVYFSATAPRQTAVLLAQAVVVAAVVASLFRVGRRALLAWSLPVGFVLLCSTVLTIGRFAEFGDLTARVITYVFGAAVPCSLAVLLAFTRQDGRHSARRRRIGPRWRAGLAVTALAAVLAGSVVSGIGFADRWSRNPTRGYLTTLRAQLAAHPDVALFDTALPERVLPYIEPNRRLSDIVPLLGADASFDVGGAEIVDDQGHIVPARFLPAAQLPSPKPHDFCDYLLAGGRTRTWPLAGDAGANEWFLRLDYFQQHASVVHVSLLSADGSATAPVSGASVVLGNTLATTYLRFPWVDPVALRLSSESSVTNVCVTAGEVGFPSPVGGTR